MTGGGDSDDEESGNESRIARLLMVAVLALAVMATAVLVLSDSARWLRLGVLAALWAALLGVFLASRFRKTMAERDDQVADLQSAYEMELEREVAARREYEFEVEAAARKRVDEANREDLAELRAELRLLRENLERLTGGEVLVERFALRAQSTRMRSLSDAQPRVVASGEDSARLRRSLMAAPGTVDSASTELIPRPEPPRPVTPVRREPQRRQAQRPTGYRQEPARQASQDDADRQRIQVPADRPTRVAQPVRQPQQAQRPRRPAEQQQQQQAWPSPQVISPTPAPQPPVARPAPQRPTTAPRRPQQPVARQNVRRDTTPGDVGLSARLDGLPVPPREEPSRAESTGGHRRITEQTQRAEPVGERSRHSVTPQPQPAPQEHGSHHRVEPVEPSYAEWRQESAADPETTGAHAAGRSVTELLAAHGNATDLADDSPRRHRRRAD
ncbi:MAG TPA: DUF6779 domain-containing protein [Pseudonocardiaceae bacterium]|nr:DUF6779 domain-containing protein [Pseudonocardiaceae bacterium]